MTIKHQSSKKNSTNVRIEKILVSITKVAVPFLWLTARPLISNIIKIVFFTPMTYRMHDIEKYYRSRGLTFSVIVNGKSIKCWKWGDGPAVLFVHGWSGSGTQFIRFFDSLLSKGFSVITFDAPAHGATGSGTSSYFEFTEAVRGVLQYCRTNNKITGIVGHSLGASAVVNAIEKDRVKLKTILISPALKLNELLNSSFRHFGISDTIYNSIIRDYENEFGYNFKRDNPYDIMMTYPIKALIIHDMDDNTVLWEDSKSISESNKMITLKTTRGLGHKWILVDENTVRFTTEYLSSE